jgi:type IV pilus assembly protein PilA
MILKLRQRLAQEESGFTLIELLVVMLILGILAAIAIPAFLNQSQKGEDSKAIADVRTAETAAETLAVQNAGSYSTLSPANLVTIEPAVGDFTGAPWNLAANPTNGGQGYVITVTSPSNGGRTFTLTRLPGGTKQRSCGPVDGGSCVSGTWGQ